MTYTTQQRLDREELKELTVQADQPTDSNALTLYQSLILRAMFWRPRHAEASNWLAQIPFLFWLVEAQRPGKIIELGTQDGLPYFAFCQAIERLNLPTDCFSIYAPSEKGIASFDQNSQYRKVKAVNDSYYAAFSKLARTSNEIELRHIENSSIDLLNINKFTDKFSARAEVELWLPKLSDHGIILLHGINSDEEDSVNSAIYHQLRTEYPSFEFSHGDGLGILFIGNNQNPAIRTLLNIREQHATRHLVREMFSHLGQACIDACTAIEQEKNLKTVLAEARKYKAHVDDLRKTLDQNNLLPANEKDQFAKLGVLEVTLQNIKEELKDKTRIGKFESAALHSENLSLKRSLDEKNRELATLAQIISDGHKNQSIMKNGSKQVNPPNRSEQDGSIETNLQTANNISISNRLPSPKEAEVLNLINESGLFDREWYLARNQDVAQSNLDPLQHYLFFGADEGRDPSPFFQTREYLQKFPKISELKINPLIHHILQTRSDERSSS